MRTKRVLSSLTICVALYILVKASAAQSSPVPNTAAADALLDRTIAANVLTTPGSPPFHAVLEIAAENIADTEHQGHIELFWAEPAHYALKLDSPKFHQSLIVHGEVVQESDEGDFYPTWLQNFVNALLDPLAQAKGLRGHVNTFEDKPYFADFCIERDDRHNNVLDAPAYARVCFNKAQNLQFIHALDFTHSLNLDNFKPFHAKTIARTYEISTRDDTKLRGTLTTLEDWSPNKDKLAIIESTPPSGRILTDLVSTATEKSLLESAPKDVHWPDVPEGKLDGYMVIHAVTDRTGQVREASQYESDNMALQSFGRELALQYKFKPLLVEGVPQQMEMPLVLHFKTVIGTPIPEVDDAWLRANAKRCRLPTEINQPSAAGKQVEVTLRIGPDGKLHDIHGADTAFAVSLFREFPSCQLPPVLQNGHASEYLAHLKVTAR